MKTSTIQLATPDGPCTTEVVTPEGQGPWPAVIEFFDAGGLRPAQTRIAERIAKDGYLVLQPDLFHRSPPVSTLFGGPVTLAAFAKMFQDPDLRARFMADYYLPALAYENLGKTVGAVLEHIAGRPDFRGRVGTTGYCMGGNASVRTATIFGDRIAATAAFHPGGLVTDQPDSPHTRAKASSRASTWGLRSGTCRRRPRPSCVPLSMQPTCATRSSTTKRSTGTRSTTRRSTIVRPPNGTTPPSPGCMARR